jgi:hypothetical protein
VDLYLLKRTWFSVAKTSASVSFQFDKRLPQGVVVNRNGATIGELVGDGTELSIEHGERVNNYFEVCLVIQNFTENSQYPIKDFGHTTTEYNNIYPLNLTTRLVVRAVHENVEFWCVNLTTSELSDTNTIMTFFPIVRYEDYENYEQEWYSHKTTSLVYTLGACYCFDLFLLVLFLIVLGKSVTSSKQKSVPIVAWLGIIFGVLCIFRIVFCFLWPVNGFGDNTVAEYAVFEIPTFLLFSAVILAIGYWRKLSKKKYVIFFLCLINPLFHIKLTTFSICAQHFQFQRNRQNINGCDCIGVAVGVEFLCDCDCSVCACDHS